MYTLCPPEPLSYKSAFVFLHFSVLVDLALEHDPCAWHCSSCRPSDNLPYSATDLTIHLSLDGAIPVWPFRACLGFGHNSRFWLQMAYIFGWRVKRACPVAGCAHRSRRSHAVMLRSVKSDVQVILIVESATPRAAPCGGRIRFPGERTIEFAHRRWHILRGAAWFFRFFS